MRQCHILGLVQRELKSIKKQSQQYSVQGFYKIPPKGTQFVQNGDKLLIPINKHNQDSTRSVLPKTQSSSPPNKRVRKGKGTHGLTVVR